MTELKNLLVEKRDDILMITVNREKALNALNDETITELQQVFNNHKDDKSIRCVILTGAGKAFVAGADIGELAAADVTKGKAVSEKGLKLMDTIQNYPRPVIAAVNGFALGGGCEMAMACDIRLASEKARLGQPEVNLGLIPGYGGTQRLSRLVGRGKAMQLILSGEMITAAEAHRIGLVDEIYPPEQLMEKALELAKLINSKSPVAVKMAKECINRGLDMTLENGCKLEMNKFGDICGTEDKKEGTAAFLEKRKANFPGK
ncbi:MAG: enoyl-CoA hydratase-related protein [candidate division Zixibacteria bacterium]|nr:enoyl-CoA hydratase-related protein [candidate division Zixibacteria bacterium]MDD5426279.1 enoyl-CoA hydratase-related protein [candidate division Zixibacteria bacterium]